MGRTLTRRSGFLTLVETEKGETKGIRRQKGLGPKGTKGITNDADGEPSCGSAGVRMATAPMAHVMSNPQAYW